MISLLPLLNMSCADRAEPDGPAEAAAPAATETTEQSEVPSESAGDASPVPLTFSLPLLLPAIAVVAYILGRLYAPRPQIVTEPDDRIDPPDDNEDPSP